MRHLGIDKSPAAPRGFNEYLNTRMYNVQRGLALQKRQQQKADEQRQLRTKGKTDLIQPLRPGILLHHNLSSDRLSPVFGADLCWNACYTAMDNAPHNERVEWPPLTAFKEAGRRVGSNSSGRSLPLPRQNQIRELVRMIEGDGANDEAGPMDYREKAVKLDRLGLSRQQSLLEPDTTGTCDIDLESLPAWTREIIAEIKLDEEENSTMPREEDEGENKQKKYVPEQKED
ncbi:g2 m phase checkpoint control protein [Colletotrichum incanum]|uniref:G2 m phase checkpoint control protein n=1 Tax=Colletotrichum incanum TaxID=1573173 RepID=A0A162P4U0_COLIC|nr:g2 m phase checkpoint control protein [Colletotrichum incanum]OHW90256.1 hypothetical protein CSPAE12_11127 [Colletotrichum incanum]